MISTKQLAKHMSTTNKKDIKDNISLINLLVNCVKEYIENGEKVNLNHLWRFSLVERAERVGVCPYDGRELSIPARTSLKFETTKAYHNELKNFNNLTK